MSTSSTIGPIVDGPPAVDTDRAGPDKKGHTKKRRRIGAWGAFGGLVILLVVVIGTIGPLLAPHDPAAQDLVNRLAGPSRDHLLGTDSLGRDQLSRLLLATRISLLASAQAISIALILGVPAGLLSGYVGGMFEAVANRVADTFLSIPPIVLALSVVAALGLGLTNAMVGIGLVYAPRFFRVARASARVTRSMGFVDAARTMGSTPLSTLWHHILPNAMSPLLVQTSVAVGLAVVAESALSFLGAGVQVPDASWGSMLRDAARFMEEAPHLMFPPGIMVTATVLAFSLLGDTIRDVLGRGGSR
mgnify:CR=1 FL=1